MGEIEETEQRDARVLLVDDESESLVEMSSYLHHKGYDCKTSSDAASALQMIEEDDEIGVIITDIRMPGMSGLEMLSGNSKLSS